jgi:hypothetical protein
MIEVTDENLQAALKSVERSALHDAEADTLLWQDSCLLSGHGMGALVRRKRWHHRDDISKFVRSGAILQQ